MHITKIPLMKFCDKYTFIGRFIPKQIHLSYTSKNKI